MPKDYLDMPVDAGAIVVSFLAQAPRPMTAMLSTAMVRIRIIDFFPSFLLQDAAAMKAWLQLNTTLFSSRLAG
jgi:hypothetical protein